MTNKTIEKQTIPFSKLLPNFKKFLPKKDNQYYDRTKDIHNNGEYLEATDSHVMIRIKQDLITEHNIAFTEGYPDLSRLSPSDFNHEININYDEVKTLLSRLKELKPFVKDATNQVVRLTFDDKNLCMIAKYTSEETRATITETRTMDIGYYDDESFEIALNINYLINILMTIKKLLSVLKDANTVKIGLVSKLRPIVFKIEDVGTLLLLPVRIV
jgi:DNA polymerase III sliding clamp (beta) subunit (PCNA family)